MAVHLFPVESLTKDENNLSMERAYSLARTYLKDVYQLGQSAEEPERCANVAELRTAVEKFVSWARQLPEGEPKLLWMRLHGVPPEDREYHVGTRGHSGGVDFRWWEIFSAATGKFPPNVVVAMDVCWGASPAAPATMTGKRGKKGNPALLFGSVRAAHPFEVEAVTGLLCGTLSQGGLPTVREAKGVVSVLNKAFPPDEKNGKPFYRVWYWKRGDLKFFPKAPKQRLKRVG